jgi:penicillin-binding protein 2
MVVGRPEGELRRAFRRDASHPFLPVTIVLRVPKEVAIRLEEERRRWPGLLVRAEPVRWYPLRTTAAHLLGYLSQPTAEELSLLKPYGVRPKELVGRMGVERLLDHALRGRPGGLLVEVNHRGQQVAVLNRRSPEAGARVVLTIDADLQAHIETSFGTQSGAAVVLDPRTGEVLAMASLPAFSPASFVASDTAAVERLLNASSSPLMNRAAIGGYQPGSVLKLVTASAALEHRLITPTTTILCPGSMPIGDRTIHCWYRDGHGPMTLNEALMQSCNVYFMHLGRRLGAQRLRAALEEAGFSRRTGWPLEEHAGHLPRRRLTEGEVALLAMGQGEVLITVLQAAMLASSVANAGWFAEPWVVASIAGRPVVRPTSIRHLPWSTETMQAIRKGMGSVVREPFGTGHRAFSERLTIAGKTGTAQTGVAETTHAWFIGFCPIEQPRAAFAIIAEHGGSGGDWPAELARAICEHLEQGEPRLAASPGPS